jgi:integrase
MHRLLAIAVFPLRAIKGNPIPPGYLPSPGPRKAFGYLYPADDRLLMAGQHAKSEEIVPLHWRMLEGFLDREGMRSGEAASLDWGDLDLKRGAVRLDENKTDDPRAWALHWGTSAALKMWRAHLDKLLGKRKAGDAVFVDGEGVRLSAEHLAARLRDHLEADGVDRPELFKSTASRRKMRAHDLRATFITLNLAAGKSETWVADRTGHRSSQQINGYRRAARTAEELGLGELTPLVLAIPELAASWRHDSEPPQPDSETIEKDADHSALAEHFGSLGSGAARLEGSSPSSCTHS